jgi:hypothetical protein
MSVAKAKMNRLTRVLDSSMVLAGAGGGGGAGGLLSPGGVASISNSRASSTSAAPENTGGRDAGHRFTEQVLEQFWLYQELG